MNLQELPIETLIEVCRRWTGADRELILREPRLAAHLGDLDGLAEDLVGWSGDLAVEGVRARVKAEDDLHDRLLRGLFFGLSAAAELSQLSAEADRWRELRDRLLPAGLAMTEVDPALEAEAAARAGALADGEDRALLDRIQVDGVGLGAQLDRWLAAAGSLDRLEAQRDRIERAASLSRVVSPRSLRRRWAAVVGVFQAELTLVDLERQERGEESLGRRLLGPLLVTPIKDMGDNAEKP
jgi:hypothetical protein